MSKLTEVLAQHRVCLEPTGWPFPRPVHRWSCPFRTLDPECEWGWAEHDRFVEEAIAAAGLAVVKLPEPDDDFDRWDIPSCGSYNGVDSTGDSVISVELTEEGIEVEVFGEQTPEESRRLAAALLAAANAAEAVSK